MTLAIGTIAKKNKPVMELQRGTLCKASKVPPNRDLSDRRPPGGMTLVEILLVLFLLVVIGSFAMPLLEGGFASLRLRRASDRVLAAWTEIRAKSIESGQVYQFRFTEDSNKYRVDPWYAEGTIQSRESDQRIDTDKDRSQFSDADDQADESNWHYESSLAADIVFAGGDRSVYEDDGERQIETLEGESPQEWSAPILFFPDGTTSEVSILLRNKHDRYQRVTLRALTGVARASTLLSEDEAKNEGSL